MSQRTFLHPSITINIAPTKSHPSHSSAAPHYPVSLVLHSSGAACTFCISYSYMISMFSSNSISSLRAETKPSVSFQVQEETENVWAYRGPLHWNYIIPYLMTWHEMTVNITALQKCSEWLPRDKIRVTSSSFLILFLVFSKHHGKGLALCFS